MKKYLLLLFCLVSSLMVSAATSGKCGPNLNWTLKDDGTLTIKGTGEMTDYSADSHAPWYVSVPWGASNNVKSVVIGEGVTSIGSYAFYYCIYLTSITIPNSVTSIGYCAFSNCRVLSSINIPNSVTSIGDSAFQLCDHLPIKDNIRYADCVAVKAINEKQSIYTLKEGTRFIHSAAFSGCSGLTSITIPNSVTSIGYWAFLGCSGLTSITIPNSVTSIEHGAFLGCSGLTSITIPNSVTSIEHDAFSSCSGLTSITIPNSVTRIGDRAFEGCDGLTSITIPNSVTSIGERAFDGCSRLTSVTIGNSVTCIEEGAFYSCPNIEVIYSHAINPPTPQYTYIGNKLCYYRFFEDITYRMATLYVPDTGRALARYLNADIWKNFENVEECDVDAAKVLIVGTPDEGFATFYSSKSAYTLPSALSAYVVTSYKNDKLTYRAIAKGSEGGVIPKGTAVVLVNSHKSASTFTLVPCESNASYSGVNYLHGSDETTTATAVGNNYFYKLTYGEGEDSSAFGWYWGAAGGDAFMIAGHRAWLALPITSSTRSAFIMDDLTDIEEVSANNNNIYYNLQGRRVDHINKAATYIVNGKKVINRK